MSPYRAGVQMSEPAQGDGEQVSTEEERDDLAGHAQEQYSSWLKNLERPGFVERSFSFLMFVGRGCFRGLEMVGEATWAVLTSPFRLFSRLPGRAWRGISLLASVTAFVVAVVAVFAMSAPWWVVPAAVGLLVGNFAAVRMAVQRERARRMPRRRPRPAAAPVAQAHAEPVAESAAPVESEPVAAPPREVAYEQAPQAAPAPQPVRREAELFDVSAWDEPAPVEEEPAEQEPVAPGYWRPTPVPRPTYSMKQAAPARREASAPVVEDEAQVLGVDSDDLDIVDVERTYRVG